MKRHKTHVIGLIAVVVLVLLLGNRYAGDIEYELLTKGIRTDFPTTSILESQRGGIFLGDLLGRVTVDPSFGDVSISETWIEKRRNLVKVNFIIPLLWRMYDWKVTEGYNIVIRHDGGIGLYLFSSVILNSESFKTLEIRNTMHRGNELMILQIPEVEDPKFVSVQIIEKTEPVAGGDATR